ncbi:MAG TPA: hypothetical protein VH643_07810 [Gemmataceae bacterium]|jgi:hypothetical protein
MFASLRALLTGILDYAGLFPPARLTLDHAIRNYARYRQELEGWMLGRFILPAARLEELEPYQDELFQTGPPFAFSVLGRGGETFADFIANLRTDLRDIAAFRKRHGDRVTVDVMELRLPAELSDPLLPDSTETLYKTMRVFPAVDLLVFCESPGRSDGLLTQLAMLPFDYVGFKLRCGGLEAAAFPSSQQIADALRGSLDAGVRFKATAGLHHPLPRFDPTVNARMHGFLNVFLAGVLAHVHDLSAEQIGRILDDEQARHFAFDNRQASWRTLRASTAEIAAARRDFVVSFGSCSFDEPRADLRALGWL